MTTILEILKYVIPSIIVLVSSYLIVQKFLVSELKRKQLALLQESQGVTIRLRLQAYERLVLFVERISPRALIPRVYVSGMTVTDLQQAITFNVRAEFEHNLSQQIYVSSNVWNTVRGVMEQEINMVSMISKQLSPDAPAKDLHTKIVDYILTVPGEMPIDVALQIINEEAKKVLSYGAMA
ncbi:MAG: hypothetical protein JST82_17320 [Bacteroidetes bacterium]|nr:hypothetical protein [Bacteroidota bacterium]